MAVAASLLTAVFLVAHGYQDRPPAGEEEAIAFHLMEGHGFSSPMDLSPAPRASAWSAPVYPMLIATAYRLGGVRAPRAVTLLMLVDALFAGLSAAAAYALGWLLFRTHGLGLLAAALIAVHPMFVYFAGGFQDGTMSLATRRPKTATPFLFGLFCSSTPPRSSGWSPGEHGAAAGRRSDPTAGPPRGALRRSLVHPFRRRHAPTRSIL